MEARGLSKDRAWGRVSEAAGREEVKVSARKKKKRLRQAPVAGEATMSLGFCLPFPPLGMHVSHWSWRG